MHSALSLAVIGALALGTDARAFGKRQFGGFGGRHGFGGGFSGFGGGRYSDDGSTPTGSFPTGSFPTGSFGSPSGIASFGTGAPVATGAPEFSAGASAPAQSFALPSSSVAVADVASSAQSSGYYGNATASYAASSAIITGGTAATTTFPEASGTSTLSEPMTVTGTFDGGMYSFGRGVSCDGQEEGGDSDAVFELEDGATLKNVIIGADQMEGVHCLGSCTIENVWWVAVCEDALTIKQTSGTSYVIGGGAQGAEDKVIQHNGGGTVSISGFYVSDFGKLYRSCGNCDEMYERHVIIENVIADSGSVLAGINSNYGDTATITNTCATNVETICEEFEGNNTGDEPTEISEGPSDYCKYTTSDVSVC